MQFVGDGHALLENTSLPTLACSLDLADGSITEATLRGRDANSGEEYVLRALARWETATWWSAGITPGFELV